MTYPGSGCSRARDHDGEDDREPSRFVLDHDLLRQCLATALHRVGVAQVLGPVEIWVESVVVSRSKGDKPTGHDFLNSFIMDDLHRVAGEAAEGALGSALRDYLRPEAEIPTGRRLDVLPRLDVVMAATAPDAVPAGRWPSKPAHALALSQQLAVSTAVGMTGTGLLGVNGPPGTGKKHEWRTAQYKRVIAVVRPELTGFEMVVA